jgi:flagella basal body P-ring formation protein FlgA
VIWAKVDASVQEPVVIAAENLHPGRPVEASQLRLEIREGFPSPVPLAAAFDQIAGKTVRRPIAAGTAICLSCVEAAQDVTRGDMVRVEVHVGGAYLELTGRAESGGVAGQSISVFNPGTRRRFAARVAGKGRVSVEEGRK